jgi:hypothetical protein
MLKNGKHLGGQDPWQLDGNLAECAKQRYRTEAGLQYNTVHHTRQCQELQHALCSCLRHQQNNKI